MNIYRESVARISAALVKLKVEFVRVSRWELEVDGVYHGVRVEDEGQGPAQGFLGFRGPLEVVGRRGLVVCVIGPGTKSVIVLTPKTKRRTKSTRIILRDAELTTTSHTMVRQHIV